MAQYFLTSPKQTFLTPAVITPIQAEECLSASVAQSRAWMPPPQSQGAESDRGYGSSGAGNELSQTRAKSTKVAHRDMTAAITRHLELNDTSQERYVPHTSTAEMTTLTSAYNIPFASGPESMAWSSITDAGASTYTPPYKVFHTYVDATTASKAMQQADCGVLQGQVINGQLHYQDGGTTNSLSPTLIPPITTAPAYRIGQMSSENNQSKTTSQWFPQCSSTVPNQAAPIVATQVWPPPPTEALQAPETSSPLASSPDVYNNVVGGTTGVSTFPRYIISSEKPIPMSTGDATTSFSISGLPRSEMAKESGILSETPPLYSEAANLTAVPANVRENKPIIYNLEGCTPKHGSNPNQQDDSYQNLGQYVKAKSCAQWGTALSQRATFPYESGWHSNPNLREGRLANEINCSPNPKTSAPLHQKMSDFVHKFESPGSIEEHSYTGAGDNEPYDTMFTKPDIQFQEDDSLLAQKTTKADNEEHLDVENGIVPLTPVAVNWALPKPPKSVWPGNLQSMEELERIWGPFCPLPIILSECIRDCAWQEKYFLLKEVYRERLDYCSLERHNHRKGHIGSAISEPMTMEKFSALMRKYPCVEQAYVRELFSFIDCQKNKAIEEPDFISGMLVASPDADQKASIDLAGNHNINVRGCTYRDSELLTGRQIQRWGLSPSALIRLQCIFLTFDADGDALLNNVELGRLLMRSLSLWANEKASGIALTRKGCDLTCNTGLRLGNLFWAVVSNSATSSPGDTLVRAAKGKNVACPRTKSQPVNSKKTHNTAPTLGYSKPYSTQKMATTSAPSVDFLAPTTRRIGSIVVNSLLKIFGSQIDGNHLLQKTDESGLVPQLQKTSAVDIAKPGDGIPINPRAVLRRAVRDTVTANAGRCHEGFQKGDVDKAENLLPLRKSGVLSGDEQRGRALSCPMQEAIKPLSQSCYDHGQSPPPSEIRARIHPTPSFGSHSESNSYHLEDEAFCLAMEETSERSDTESVTTVVTCCATRGQSPETRQLCGNHGQNPSKKLASESELDKVAQSSAVREGCAPVNFMSVGCYPEVGWVEHGDMYTSIALNPTYSTLANKSASRFLREGVHGVPRPPTSSLEAVWHASMPSDDQDTQIWSSTHEPPLQDSIQADLIRNWKEHHVDALAAALIERYDVLGDRRGLTFSGFVRAVVHNDIPGTELLFRTRKDFCSVVKEVNARKSPKGYHKPLCEDMSPRETANKSCTVLNFTGTVSSATTQESLCAAPSQDSRGGDICEEEKNNGTARMDCEHTPTTDSTVNNFRYTDTLSKYVGCKDVTGSTSYDATSMTGLANDNLTAEGEAIAFLDTFNEETVTSDKANHVPEKKDTQSVLGDEKTFSTGDRKAYAIQCGLTSRYPKLPVMPLELFSKLRKTENKNSDKVCGNYDLSVNYSLSWIQKLSETHEKHTRLARRVIAAVETLKLGSWGGTPYDRELQNNRSRFGESSSAPVGPRRITCLCSKDSQLLYGSMLVFDAPQKREIGLTRMKRKILFGRSSVQLLPYDLLLSLCDMVAQVLRAEPQVIRIIGPTKVLACPLVELDTSVVDQPWAGEHTPGCMTGWNHSCGNQNDNGSSEKDPRLLLHPFLETLTHGCEDVVELTFPNEDPVDGKCTGWKSSDPSGGHGSSHTVVLFGNFSCATSPEESIELVALLFAIKLLHPRQFIMLRGAYEDFFVGVTFGLAEELSERFGCARGQELLRRICDVMEFLPVAASISPSLSGSPGDIFCVTGGVPSIPVIPFPIKPLRSVGPVPVESMGAFKREKKEPIGSCLIAFTENKMKKCKEESRKTVSNSDSETERARNKERARLSTEEAKYFGAMDESSFMRCVFELLWSSESMKAFNFRVHQESIAFTNWQSTMDERKQTVDHHVPSNSEEDLTLFPASEILHRRFARDAQADFLISLNHQILLSPFWSKDTARDGCSGFIRQLRVKAESFDLSYRHVSSDRPVSVVGDMISVSPRSATLRSRDIEEFSQPGVNYIRHRDFDIVATTKGSL